MIQVWAEEYADGIVYTKLALFGVDGSCRFASFEGGYTVDQARSILVSSKDIRMDILPHSDKEIIWHDDDKGTIAAWYQQKIDDIQAEALNKIIGADLYRYIVYILKFLELMSVELGLRTMDESVILSHEADEDGKAALAATWSQKSTAWLNFVGISEREASKAKAAIAECDNDADMQTIVDGFSDKLSKALND